MRKFVSQTLGLHPRKWLVGIFSYSAFIGYIRPSLLQSTDADYSFLRKVFSPGWRPKELTVPVGRRILAISPHPDDESIGAGGLLWAHRGHAEIHIVLLTNGEREGRLSREEPDEHVESRSQRIGEMRKAELQETSRMLGVDSLHFLEMPDGEIPLSQNSATALGDVIRQIKPDVIILPWFLDNHVDHRAANVLLAMAGVESGICILGYEVWTLLDPNAYFDIASHIDGKRRLVENNVSQLYDADFLGFVDCLAFVRGMQLGQRPASRGAKALAEAFVALPSEVYCEIVKEVLSKQFPQAG